MIPILEVGGTHVTAAWIDPDGWRVSRQFRRQIDGSAQADELLAEFVRAADSLDAPPGLAWGMAMPGPFDYAAGIGRFTGVGKFESLNGVDVGKQLVRSISARPDSIGFINDASAFLVGEWRIGAARGADRSAAITLGTGVGSAFLADGVVIDSGPDVPPDGEVHLLVHRDLPLEDWVSRRAILREYAAAGPAAGPIDVNPIDVKEIAVRAREGDAAAATVFDSAFRTLGIVLGPWLKRFGAEVVVLGGSISKSWDLIEEPLHDGLRESGDVTVRLAQDAERSALVGATHPVVTAR